jgi:hypothetical protein
MMTPQPASNGWTTSRPVDGSAGDAPPPCALDICQPRVAVPGYEPRLDQQGRRTELFLALLDRVQFEPIASMAWAIAATGVRLDFRPRQLDTSQDVVARPGWGSLRVWLTFRIDATNAPVIMSRPGHHDDTAAP